MTEEELNATVRDLRDELRSLASEWGQFLQMESELREKESESRMRHERVDEARATAEAEEWQLRQTFLAKHGMKIASAAFAAASAGLAWYGSQIRSEIDAEQHAKYVAESVESNSKKIEQFESKTFEEFKHSTKEDIKALKRESVNQTLMIDEGFRRIDTIMIKATRLKEEDLPPMPDEFSSAVKSARKLKIENEKFGM